MKIDNSILNKQQIDKLIEKLFDTITLEYVAYTPSMIGDFNTEHYQKIRSEDGTEHYMITGYPTAKPILGKARWLMRVAIATALGLCTHHGAEKALPVTVSSGREQLEIPLIPFLLGATPAHNTVETAWRGVVSLIVEPQNKLIYNSLDNVVDEDFILYDKEMVRKVARRKGGFRLDFSNAPTRFSLLALRARPGHNGIDLDSLEKNIVPIKTGNLKFHAKIILDKHRIGLAREKQLVIAGLNLAILSIAASPLILGLGKGANRGFGRFRPENINSLCADMRTTEAGRTACESLVDLSQGEPGALSSFLKGLVEIADTFKMLGKGEEGKCDNKRSHKVPWIPLTNTGMVKVVPYRLARSRRVNASPVNQVIAAIARASMKNKWKLLCEKGKKPRDKLEKPGTPYHTWLLGLPRSQKFPRGPKEIAEVLKTGYLLVEGTHGVIFAKYSTNELPCNEWPKEHWKDIAIRDWSKLRVEEPRRQSLIVAFPLPIPLQSYRDRDTANTKNAAGQKPSVAVVAFPSYDLLDYLIDIIDKDKNSNNNNEKLVLYHAGPHRGQKCSQVLIPVRAIASQMGQIAGKPMGVRRVSRGNCSTTNYNITQSNEFDRLLRDVFDSFVEALG
ncbi:MAG: hypothetical protein F7C34_04660 [Desulfurococcales archaeon]|nr:hypothetical protein [Desulfurococcales archaeon]